MEFAKFVNSFAFMLSKQWSSGTDNMFFSPISIFTSLNLILYGSKNKTADEIHKTLYGDISVESLQQFRVDEIIQKIHEEWKTYNDSYTLKIDNKIMVAKGYDVEKEYEKIIQKIYKNTIEKVDFVGNNVEILKNCNNWVRTQTDGMIKNIVNNINEDTSLLILNAVYFAGKWDTAFDANETTPRQFFCSNDKSQVSMVPMMSKFNVKCGLYTFKVDNDNIKLLELPFKGNLTFNIMVTENENNNDILDGIRYDHIEKKTLITNRVNVKIPRFGLQETYSLNEDLRKLGIKEAFNRNADFSGISKTSNMFVSRFNHKAVIEVNEEGAKAAALSVTVCDGAQSRVNDFVANRPFVFYIQDKHNDVILFHGKVNKL